MKKIYVLLFSFVLILTANVGQANAEGFTDVKTDHRFYNEIMYLSDEGIINGYDNGKFGSDDKVTRGQAAMMIAKALGLDTTPRDSKLFTDIKITDRFSGAIESAAEEKILKGTPDGKFNSTGYVTRGDMAMIIARAFKMTEEELISFSDVSIDKRSYSAVRKILAAGVAQGYDKNKFGTEDSIKRSDFSAFLARVLNPKEFKLIVNSCGYDPATKTNPNRQTVNCLLTKEAIKQGVPPEIVKAIASQENGPWKQFNYDGTAIETPDGGIGLMQITETTGYDVEKLKANLTYNIYVGVNKLKKNFDRTALPSIGDKNPKALESWYFAVMAYNGTKAVNSPFVKATGLRNNVLNYKENAAYQEKVYHTLTNSFIYTHIDSIDMTADDFVYDANNDIKFQKLHFDIVGNVMTTSKEMFKDTNNVNYKGTGLRPQPGTTPNTFVTKTTSQDVITIIGGPVYDNSNAANVFVWYPAKVLRNGKPVYGYIASNYIK